MQEITVFDVDLSAEKIQFHKQTAERSIWEIGNQLIIAKENIMRGEWLKFLARKEVAFSSTVAENMMRVAREVTYSPTSGNLGRSKTFELLLLPASDRETFIEQPHETKSGEVKTVDEMTTRELREAIAARNEAEKVMAALQINIKNLNEHRIQQVEQFQAQLIKEQLKALPEAKIITQTVVVKPEDYDQLRAKAAKVERLERQIDDLEHSALKPGIPDDYELLKEELECFQSNQRVIDLVNEFMAECSQGVGRIVHHIALLGIDGTEYLNKTAVILEDTAQSLRGE